MDPSKSTNHPKDSYRTMKANANPRNERPLKIKIDLIKVADANTKIGCKSLGQKFSCSKTPAKTIVKK